MARDEIFQAAEKKIAEALRSGATELDLSGGYTDEDSKKLTELPESLVQLTQLQSLNLSRNQLKALPESLGQLTRLQSLQLSSNRLTSLPKWLGEFTQLQSLDLLDNQLTSLPESLGQLTQLQSLSIARNQLTALPEWLGQLTQLQSLNLSHSQLTALPEWLGQLTHLQSLNVSHNKLSELRTSPCQFTQLQFLDLSHNKLMVLPEALGCLTQLQSLLLHDNRLTALPEAIARLGQLTELVLGVRYFGGNPFRTLPTVLRPLTQVESLLADECSLNSLPGWISELANLQSLELASNHLADLPPAVGEIKRLEKLDLDSNPLNPELDAAYEQGLDAVKRYLRAKSEAQVVLNEAKLILVGEGEVGKSCLLGALRGDPWEEGKPTTHGIEIKPVRVTDPATDTEITLNGWDFGGQRVYRPTHQLFFTAPAVYLVVWKPREGPQQGFVKEWIKLVKHREPDARILVVATHGGRRERQPDIDRQEIWDLFGRDTVVDFFLVQSKPDEATGERRGVAELRAAIARVASGLPEMGRSVPKHWQEVRQKLSQRKEAWLPLKKVFHLCRRHKVRDQDARLLVRICHRVGDLIHFEHDPMLRGIVVLKPDWLATAISFVLDDEHTRNIGHGLISFERLGQLWNNPDKPEEDRYPAELHPIFLRLMERFDLCYRVAEAGKTDAEGPSLIAQLVPDVRPDPVPGWAAGPDVGDEQQVQICRIVEAAKNLSATAEGIFYLLIVRLHKYSLGRANYAKSVHWQRGLVLQDYYGARAYLEHIANDIRITVRSPFPERFLAALTYEIEWLVKDFWEGLRCEVTVPCIEPQPNGEPCIGLFEVRKLLENKKRGRPEQPCQVCNEWQDIEQLLRNAPASSPDPLEMLLSEFATVQAELAGARQQLIAFRGESMDRFDQLDIGTQRILSRVEDGYTDLMQSLTDEAKEGPRLFSFQPVDPGFFDRPKWINQKFRLTLWCEHSRLPLPELNGEGSKAGVYELSLPRQWFEKAAPFLKVLTGTLSLVLPVASSATKFVMDEAAYKGLETELDLGQKSLDSVLKGGQRSGMWLGRRDAPELERGEAIQAQGAILRQLHARLKEKDPSFGGLVRVQNKRQEFLWVHPQFEREY